MVCRRPVTQVGQLYQDAVSVSDVVSLSVPEQGVICSSLTMRTFSCPRHCLCPAGTGLHCSMVSAGVKTFQLSPEVMPLSPGWLQGSSQSSDHLHGLPPPGSHGRVTLLRGKTEVLGLVRTLASTVLCRLFAPFPMCDSGSHGGCCTLAKNVCET